MGRRKKVEEDEDIIEEAEVIMRWSPKRIVVATVLVVVIIVGGIYTLSLMSQNKSSVLGETSNKPQIKLPDEKSFEEVIETAQEELGDINAKNIVESQPKIKKIIDDLNRITGSSDSAKDLICESLCK